MTDSLKILCQVKFKVEVAEAVPVQHMFSTNLIQKFRNSEFKVQRSGVSRVQETKYHADQRSADQKFNINLVLVRRKPVLISAYEN